MDDISRALDLFKKWDNPDTNLSLDELKVLRELLTFVSTVVSDETACRIEELEKDNM